MDTRTNPHRLRVEALRVALRRHDLAAVLVPSADPHLSEYLPGRWQGREWVSGFTGSVATLAVTLDEAVLFADSRYWVQADAQLTGSGIALERIPTGPSQHHLDWLATHLKPGETLAVDGEVMGLAAAQALQARLQAAGIALRTDLDLLGEIWPERPGLPQEPVYEHQAPQATQSRGDKLGQIRSAMARLGATHHWVSTLDDLAWIFNLRGADVSYNPVFLAHALIDASGATLYLVESKLPATVRAALAADGVRIAPYEQAAAGLRGLPAEAVLLLDPRRVTLGLRQQVAAGVRVVESINPSTLAKSRKTGAEADHIRRVMEEDGAAMCEFYAAFEASMARGDRWTELDVDTHLTAARARRPGFVGLSFSTIAGWNANGAMPHYRALPESHAVIEGDGLLLIDSGGQYLGGTTDITRVWPVGTVSAAMRRDYTLVLKGTIGLSATRFPRGTLSPMLDAIARQPLWAQGLDYGHGTGHGVGYFLNVHEGPQSISKALPEPAMAMQPGMITSIEPGLYRPDLWGVRIENLVLNVPAQGDAVAAEAGAFGEFLEFETLTLCPIDTRCLDRALLREDEIAWLNAYHAEVRRRLAPKVEGATLAWLVARTEPIA